MTRITASALDRLMRCSAGAALPQVQTSSGAANRGTATHAFIEQVRTGAERLAQAGMPYEDALAQARIDILATIDEKADHFALCAAVDFTAIPRGAESELTVAWSPSTGEARILGRGLNRDYSAARGDEIVATLDLAGVMIDEVYDGDFKTGKAVDGGAAGSWQMRFGTMALARAAGKSRGVAQLVYPRSDGRAYVDTARFSGLQLAAFASELRRLLERIERDRAIVASGGVPDVYRGAWCTYCPAIAACPGVGGVIGKLVKRASEAPTPEYVRAQLASLTPEQAGALYLDYESARLFLKHLDSAYQDYARQCGGIPIPDGRVLREVVTVRREIKGLVANNVLLTADEKLPEQERIALDAINYEPIVSRSSIERAIRARRERYRLATKKRAPGSINADVDAVLAEIAKAGGIEERISAPVKPVRAGDIAVPDADNEAQGQRR